VYKKLFSETLIYGLGSVIPRLINFLLISFITKPIGVAEFSIYTQLYGFASMINVFLSFGFETTYFRYASENDNEKKVFNTAFIFLTGLSIFFLLMVYLGIKPITYFTQYQQNPEYIIWFSWFIILDNICVIPFARLRYLGKPLYYTIVKLMNIFIMFGLVIFFLKIIQNVPYSFLGFEIKQKIGFVFVANFFASFLTIFMLIPVLKNFSFSLDRKLFFKMIQYSSPIMFGGLAFALNENFDKMIQRRLISNEDAGAYGACYKLAALMSVFVMAFRMGVEPFFFKQMKSDNPKQTYATTTELFTIIGGLIVVVLLGNIEWLKDIFLKRPEYFTAMNIVPIIITANLCSGIYNTMSVWYKVTDKTYIGSRISWFAAILTVALNLILLKYFGFMVSAWVTLLAYGSMLFLSYYLGQKHYKIPYKIRKIMLYMILSVSLGSINFYLLNSSIIFGNLFILIYLGIVYYLEKNYLLKAILK